MSISTASATEPPSTIDPLRAIHMLWQQFEYPDDGQKRLDATVRRLGLEGVLTRPLLMVAQQRNFGAFETLRDLDHALIDFASLQYLLRCTTESIRNNRREVHAEYADFGMQRAPSYGTARVRKSVANRRTIPVWLGVMALIVATVGTAIFFTLR